MLIKPNSQENTMLKTKYGNAKIQKDGYYMITSGKEGNHGKLLHRLIWEDWYKKPVPDGYVIHHINGNKTDNRIQNLQCVSKEAHTRFHHKGRNYSDEFKRQRSMQYKGKGNPMYGKKRSREEMKGLIFYNIKHAKVSYFDNYCGIVYLMHRKNAGLVQRDIIKEIGASSSSYISKKLKILNMSWRDL